MGDVSVDSSRAERRLAGWGKGMSAVLARHLTTLPASIRSSVLAGMDAAKLGDGEWSTSDRLGTRSGGLREALDTGKRGNITTLAVTATGARLRFGVDTSIIRHALTHERGMKIRSKGRMHRFFWARYAEAGGEAGALFYKIMALHVMRYKSITIPKRAWWAPGIARFRTTLPARMAEIKQGLIQGWEATA